MAWLHDVIFFNRCTIISIIITSVYLRQTFGQFTNYKFRLGSDAKIPFSYVFTDDSQHSWEIFRVGIHDPFNINGTMYPDALNPAQRDRIIVSATWRADSLRVNLHIFNISEIDKGVYVWAVSNHRRKVKREVRTFDVFINVILPPGRAVCNVSISPYDDGLREVPCRANVGSDGAGQLICYQDGEKATFQSAPVISGTRVTGVFWMNIKKSIRCCSHEVNFVKDPSECNDFTQSAKIEPISTTKPATPISTTLNILMSKGKAVLTELPIGRERTSDSSTNTRTTYGDHYICKNECSINYTISFICLFVISLFVNIYFICAKYRTRKIKTGQESTKNGEATKSQMNPNERGPEGVTTSESKDAKEDNVS